MAVYRNTSVNAQQARVNSAVPQDNKKTGEEKQVAVNGYQQVVEMLQAADPAFRQSLLARIARRDPELARRLREHF